MRYLLLLILLLLTSCSTTEGWKVNKATRICAEKGGVDYIESVVLADYVMCNNGEFINLRSKK